MTSSYDAHIDFPTAGNLRINLLAGIFNNVSASYKYVFFLSILSIAKKQNFTQTPIPLKTIEHEMLKTAWYPHTFFKLNFGYSDQLAVVLDDMSAKLNYTQNDDTKNLDTTIKNYLKSNTTTLLNMVPYRLINALVNKPGYSKTSDLDVIKYSIDCCREEKPSIPSAAKPKAPPTR